MAKGNAMGLWRGKKGSSVFYKITNSNNAQKQGIREWEPNVENPQTSAQIDQRVKLLPAQRVANQINEIVRRSWQGVKYGGMGRQEFMKRALTMDIGFPYVDKDDDRTIPGAYQISKGTIGEVLMEVNDIDAMTSNLGIGSYTVGDSWGDISESLIINNDIKNGDQITVVACVTTAANSSQVSAASYLWEYYSVIVDTESTDITQPQGNYSLLDTVQISAGNNVLAVTSDSDKGYNLAAAAIIISRLNGDSYLRSSATLCVNFDFLSYWFASARGTAAKRTYKKSTSSSTSTNWPVDPEGGSGSGSGTTAQLWTITGATGDYASLNGKLAWVRGDENNVPRSVYIISNPDGVNDGALVGENGQGIDLEVSGAVTYGKPANVPTLATLPTIVWTGEPV